MPTLEPKRSVLILFPGALGDFLCALPSFCALQRAHGVDTLLGANPAALELVEHGPFRTASIQRREVADLFATGPPLATTSALLGGFAVTHSWTGHDDPRVARRLRSISGGIVHMHRFRGMAPGEHVVDYCARCVGLAPLPAQVWTTPADDEWAARWLARHVGLNAPLLIIHPGSGAPRKNWEGFRELLRVLSSQWGAVAALLGPAEAEQTPPLDLGIPTVRDANLRQVAALLRRAALYVGNDSGISHLAATVGTPSVVLFGATDALRWAPRGATIIEAREACSVCGPQRLCTHRISVGRVLETVERFS